MRQVVPPGDVIIESGEASYDMEEKGQDDEEAQLDGEDHVQIPLENRGYLGNEKRYRSSRDPSVVPGDEPCHHDGEHAGLHEPRYEDQPFLVRPYTSHK